MADLDVEILRVLERRARLAREVGALRGPGAVSLPSHEQDQIHAVEALAQEELPPGALASVLREVHSATLAFEQPLRVAYVGPEGGFGELAARKELGAGATLVPVDGSAEAFEEVVRKRADYAVVPYESSSEGLIQSTIVALTEAELMLVAVTELEVVLSLMNKTGNLADVEKLYAHPAHRNAAQKHIAAKLPKATLVEVRSAKLACELAFEDHGAATLVPERIGLDHGLVPIESNIGDVADLRLRFGIASTRPTSRTGSDTTALVFSVHDQPGSLFDALSHFAERGLNLRTIHSRPMPGEKWAYLFYVEVNGHLSDRPIVTALEAVKRQARFLKVLGSYPSI